MLLRTRVALMVLATYLLMAGGLAFFSIKSDELSDRRYAEATLNGQELFWRKLIENTVQRLEAVTPLLDVKPDMITAVSKRNVSALTEIAAPINALLPTYPVVSLWEVISPEGELLYSSRGGIQETPLIDAGTVLTIVESGVAKGGGVVQDSENGFIAAIARPIFKETAWWRL